MAHTKPPNLLSSALPGGASSDVSREYYYIFVRGMFTFQLSWLSE